MAKNRVGCYKKVTPFGPLAVWLIQEELSGMHKLRFPLKIEAGKSVSHVFRETVVDWWVINVCFWRRFPASVWHQYP